MSELEQEKAFEAYLARRGTLGRPPGAADDLEPPEELDRIVLANAREAIRLGRSPPPFKPVRWALPVGLAATVVLSFAVLLHFGLLPRTVEAPPPVIEAQLHVDSTSHEAAPLPEVEVPPPPRVQIESAEPTRRGELAKAAPRKKEALSELRAADSSRAAASPAPAPPAAAAPVAAATTMAERNAQVSVRVAEPPEDPAAWLRRIEALRAQGQAGEAEREWQAFRKAWPDYPVPGEPQP